MAFLLLHNYTDFISNLIQKNIDNLVSGTTKQKELSLQKIIKLNIPLPPLKEQERIVAKIEMIRESIKRIDF
ncbi:TPA: restriction endonuclease subunit S [Enterococcus faecium]|uniref:restriction endonuclease subunit S n=1 Tax=Enterococcus faecium TaxID=1352 RepID=UPI0010B4C044|nr:restriction endonuclease subunit S [Enterococcus faecium]MDW3610479.1 restriction endonuclease subunit S [Enterococcus faecium]MEB8411233.1 restriction endonuclease subunit S [Enterococcus faecium]BBI27935.1 hypothetical protein EFQU50_pQL00112 [Enterococcus faecium]